MVNKELFDKCIAEAIEIGRPHLRVYDDLPTQQEWDLALILFQEQLRKGKNKILSHDMGVRMK